MKKILFLLFPILLVYCSNEQTATASTSVEKASTKNTDKTNNDTDSEAKKTSPSKNGPGLNLWIEGGEVQKGEEVCIDVTVSKIQGLLSMQYSLRWDPKIIKFKAIQGFTIPTMGISDFGRHRSNEGILTAVWIDETLKGVNINDGDILYQLCFTAIGEAGTSCPVRFWSSPTPYEVVVLPEKIIPLTAHKGTISIQ